MANPKENAVSGVGSTHFLGGLACLTAFAYLSYQRQDFVAVAVAGAVGAGAMLGRWKGVIGFASVGLAAVGAVYLAETADQVLRPTIAGPLESIGVTSDTALVGVAGTITFLAIQSLALMLGRRLLAA